MKIKCVFWKVWKVRISKHGVLIDVHWKCHPPITWTILYLITYFSKTNICILNANIPGCSDRNLKKICWVWEEIWHFILAKQASASLIQQSMCGFSTYYGAIGEHLTPLHLDLYINEGFKRSIVYIFKVNETWWNNFPIYLNILLWSYVLNLNCPLYIPYCLIWKNQHLYHVLRVHRLKFQDFKNQDFSKIQTDFGPNESRFLRLYYMRI